MRELRNKPLRWLLYGVLFTGAFVAFFPFIWMILSSFKTPQEAISIPPTLFPDSFTNFKNYQFLLTTYNFITYFKNSIFITTVSIASQLYTAALFGYVLGKIDFKLKNVCFLLVMFCMMVPNIINIIPMYNMMVKFHWIDSFNAVILTNLITLFGIFMMRQFMYTVPDDMLEAARIDGCSELRLFHRIVFPMLKNPLSALAILQFLWVWDSYLWPLLVLNDPKNYTVVLGLGALNGRYGTPVELALAGASMAVVPVLVIYLVFQKRFVSGVALSGMKA
ncbi:MAG: carbohydrate ABC transporter permease [Ruminiclostridium sp.]|nr:carbohydrate ABC transporter permease [Ruminiclostridium sp.]